MKNKKLFAILTLVCFMFTLMPVAAFATVDTTGRVFVTDATEYTDKLSTTATSITAKVSTAADAGQMAGNYVYYVINEAGNGVYVTTGSTVAVTVGGDYKVYAAAYETAELDGLVAVINGIDTMANKVAKVKAWAEGNNRVCSDFAVVDKDAAEYTYSIGLAGGGIAAVPGTTDVYSVTIPADAGWTAATMTATLSAAGAPDQILRGQELTFTTVGFVDVELPDGNKTEYDKAVDFKLASDRSGDYSVVVSYGKLAKATLKIHVNPANLAVVSANNVPTAPANIVDDVKDANVEFKFTDANGTAYVLGVDGSNVVTDSQVKLTLVSKPADSKLESTDFRLIKETTPVADAAGVYTVERSTGNNSFDKEGEYTFKVTLRSGATAEATVKAAKQGDVVGIVLVKPVTAIVYDGAKEVVTSVKTVDANGVLGTIADMSAVVWSVSGKAVVAFDDTATHGGTASNNIPTLLVEDEDFIGQKVTVYAKYNNFVTTSEVVVTDKAANIVYSATTGEVGVTNKLSARVFDENGKAVTIGSTTPTMIVLEKPENAIAIASATYTDATGVTLSLLGSVAGEYKVQTVINYNDNGIMRYLTSIDTFTLGAVKGEFKDVIVMSIGANSLVKNSEVIAMPAAPVIVDGRTMVPARAGLEAFGATVEWNEVDRTVTAELNGVKVVMTIDEKAYTVNGKTVVGDAAPFISEASTMVPVSFFTNAFGIVATPIYDANGVCDVLFTK